jgi:TolB-like protein
MKKAILYMILSLFYFQLFAQEQPVITVLDFATSNISKDEAQLLVDYLSSGIIDIGKYRVIDRAQRENLLNEQKFSLSAEADDTNKEYQLEIGRLLSAKFIIVGSVGDVSDVFLLNTKLIDVETGETLRTVSEKYDSMKKLIDNSETILNQLLGTEKVRDADNRISGAQTVTELEQKLERMKRHLNKDKFLRWVAEVDMIDIESNGTVEERIQLVEYYKKAIQTHGIAIEWHLGKNFDAPGFNFGPGFSYQFSNSISIGLNTYFTLLELGGDPKFPFDFMGGPKIVLFNKVGGFGLSLHGLVGIYYDSGVQVTGGGGIGIYFRSLYADLLVVPNSDEITFDLNIGYSFFFGTKP